jgi:hypothetical protein
MPLQDFGSAAVLDGHAHRIRKQMLMSCVCDAFQRCAGSKLNVEEAPPGPTRSLPRSSLPGAR